MRGVREALADQDLSTAVRAVAEAALDGDAALQALLKGSAMLSPGAESGGAGPLGPVWLERLRVSGFQGIGQEVDLAFDPQPGLTVLIGRNGAGKSSLAEALQIAITRTSSRWEGKTKAWKDGWRNLHATEQPAVETDFLVEGSADRLSIRASWTGTTATPKVSIRRGAKAVSDDTLGWEKVLDVYRPFLAYTELGALLGGKSTVAHDALMRGLNLSELDEAIKSLRAEATRRSRVWTAALDQAEELRAVLEQHHDPRVDRCIAALTTRSPQLDVIAEIIAGSDPQAAQALDPLRAASTLYPVDTEAIERAAQALIEAVAAKVEISGTEAGRDLGIADLLARAIAFHTDHGDRACPVCGEGQLDASWHDDAAAEEQALRARTEVAATVERRLDAARLALTDALPGQLPSLDGLPQFGIEVEGPVRGLEGLLSVRRIEDDSARALAAIERAEVVANAFATIRAEAEQAIHAQEDTWRDLHPRIVAWYHDAREAERAHQWYEPVKAAQKALEGILDALRAERWEPIASEVIELWEQLRINSNVDLGSLKLSGSGTGRRIDYDLSVDGQEDAALGVMSQGELTALALALFLPRVTLPDSPFKFLILDDPVQSMDLARVDGLARVLERLSRDRQIVVLTHDERLREALTRQQIAATILRVSRAPNSVVSVQKVSTPWEMYLSDAHALSAGNVPVELARVSVPVLGRLAIESKCIHLIRSRVLSSGGMHEDADAIIDGLLRLTDKVAYARFAEPGRGGDLYAELSRAWGGWSVDTLKACSEGAHGEFAGDARQLTKNIRRFLKELA